MASPEDLAREIASVGELLQAQVDAGLPREDVLVSLFNSWTSKLGNCTKLSDKGKLCLTQAIKAGPWDPTQMKDLASVVLAGKGGVGKASPTRRPNQKIARIENFIPMDTMIKLRDPAKYSRLSRLSLLAGAARAVGIECPDQPSLYRMVALVAWAEGSWGFSQEEVYSAMDRIQLYVKGVPRNKDLPYIEHYPVSASLLPDDVKKIAFPGGELPADLDLPDLDVILGGNRMRGREAKTKQVPAWRDQVPEELRATVLNAVQGSASSSSQPPAPLPLTASPQAAGNVVPIADVLRFATPQPSPSQLCKPGTLPEQPSQQQQPKTPSEQPVADPDIDEFEQNMLNALRSRNGGKNRASAATKKPASAHASVSKKPATGAGTWKNVHSKIYAATRKAHYAKTGDDSAARAKASEACAKAKIKFMAGTLKY